MKIDAEVKFLTDKGQYKAGDNVSIPVDEDYCVDFDDVLKYVESELYEKHGVNAYANVDFNITNYEEICQELDESIGL